MSSFLNLLSQNPVGVIIGIIGVIIGIIGIVLTIKAKTHTSLSYQDYYSQLIEKSNKGIKSDNKRSI